MATHPWNFVHLEEDRIAHHTVGDLLRREPNTPQDGLSGDYLDTLPFPSLSSRILYPADYAKYQHSAHLPKVIEDLATKISLFLIFVNMDVNNWHKYALTLLVISTIVSEVERREIPTVLDQYGISLRQLANLR
ncbi:MAG: hypothetical protein WC773_02505 [Patescibacteria group bacterium]|jgi:hypothetical protein